MPQKMYKARNYFDSTADLVNKFLLPVKPRSNLRFELFGVLNQMYSLLHLSYV